MSTSITQLPGTAASSTPIEDANVLSVIDEMQQVVAPAQPTVAPPPALRMMVPPPMSYGASKGVGADAGAWMDKDRAQKALVAAVIALALFYPGSLQMVYSKLPRFEAFFASYDLMIRAALFAVVIYLLLWKLDL